MCCHFVGCSVLFAIFHTSLLASELLLPSFPQVQHFCFRIISLSAVGSLRFYDATAKRWANSPARQEEREGEGLGVVGLWIREKGIGKMFVVTVCVL